MPQVPPPTPDKKLRTYKGVEIYVLDATMGHTRTGWNHHQDRFCVVLWDPIERADRGLVGDDLDDILLTAQHDIDKRKPLLLN
jgi:hypothetical protein